MHNHKLSPNLLQPEVPTVNQIGHMVLPTTLEFWHWNSVHYRQLPYIAFLSYLYVYMCVMWK